LGALALTGCNTVNERGKLMSAATVREPRVVRHVLSLPPSVRALLAAQPAPNCTIPANEANADERQKLDYERQCYRQAEIIVRDRLLRLQKSVAAMDRAN
jgi:hypothetical protein